ncbi:MAG: YicC family protein [Rhizobiaceae bacterium]|nr:YicC family protein [Rhizobiaceae bacterium]
MTVASMTGFSRVEGEVLDTAFVWELRSVNGKGLDLRLRMPQGMEPIEADVRRLAGARLSRGNVQLALTLRRVDDAPVFSVNEAMLAQVLALTDRLIAAGHAVTPTADGILSVKGIIEVADISSDPEAEAARRAAVLEGFSQSLDGLIESRGAEGAVLAAVLDRRLREIAALVERAETDPARSIDAIRRRLADQVQLLLGAAGEAPAQRFDEARLHQEVAILVSKADIREELDRLRVHVAAARTLLAQGGPIGRRLDFLSQEFNRESNTLCSKSNASSLTAIGLELKVVIDQFREQVQNIE